MCLFGFKKKEHRVAKEALQAVKRSEENLNRVQERWREVTQVSVQGRSFLSEYEKLFYGDDR